MPFNAETMCFNCSAPHPQHPNLFWFSVAEQQVTLTPNNYFITLHSFCTSEIGTGHRGDDLLLPPHVQNLRWEDSKVGSDLKVDPGYQLGP